MAVALDATGTALIGGSSVSSINYSGITVGSGSNRVLIATLCLGVANTVSSPSATWDSGGSNQSMTLIGSVTTGSAGSVAYAALFGLRNPTAGTKTLAFSWTGANFPSCEAISFTGVTQTSDAAAFAHFNSSPGAGGQAINITSATNNMVVGLFAATGSLTSINNTQIYLDTTSNGDDSAACRAAGAATVSISTVGGGGSVICGVDIVAGGAAAAFIGQPRLKTYLRR